MKSFRFALPCWIAVLVVSTLTFSCSGSAYAQGEKKQGIGHKAKEGLRDTTDALSITPHVKSAIIADPQLRDKRNHINVGTKDYVLHLKGHVYSSAMKSRAGLVAARKLQQMHKNYKVSNELTIVSKK